MKKYFLFFLMVLCAISVNAQVSYSKPQKPNYEFIGLYEHNCIYHHFEKGDVYTLMLGSDNEFEEKHINIRLGYSLEEAINSLKAIQRMLKEGENDDIIHIPGNGDFHIATYGGRKAMYQYVEYAAGSYSISLKCVAFMLKELETKR